jgi:hypothetical protein
MRGWKGRVMRLVVALPQPREQPEDPGVALRGERPIGALESSLAGRCNIAVDHRPLDFRADVAPRVLEHRGEVIGGMADQRVLEIEKAEMRRFLRGRDQHHVFGVIVAKHRHRAKAVGDRLEHLHPCRAVGIDVDLSPSAGQYQSVNRDSSSSHSFEPVDGRGRASADACGGGRARRWQARKARALAIRVIGPLREAASRRNRPAAEAPLDVAGEDFGRAEPTDCPSHSAIATNGRTSSRGGGASISTADRDRHRSPGNSGGTMRRRQAARPAPRPSRSGEESVCAAGIGGFGSGHWGGHRCCHDGGHVAVKRRAPPCRNRA